MKKKIIVAVAVALSLIGVYYFIDTSLPLSQEKTEKIREFLRTLVAETLQEDYQRHHITITVSVTNVTIDKITKEKHPGFISYTVYGRLTYIVKGKREWHDDEGNLIRLDPEGEITHWFRCEIYEDIYGELYKDKYRNRLEFYADNPLQ